MNLILDIVSNEEKEDKIELNIKIFSNSVKNLPPKIIIS